MTKFLVKRRLQCAGSVRCSDQALWSLRDNNTVIGHYCEEHGKAKIDEAKAKPETVDKIPEDVLSYLCAVAGGDHSGEALRLIAKYAPDVLFPGQP